MSKLRVAAYCRVSTNHKEQESCLEAKISYYGKTRLKLLQAKMYGVHR